MVHQQSRGRGGILGVWEKTTGSAKVLLKHWKLSWRVQALLDHLVWNSVLHVLLELDLVDILHYWFSLDDGDETDFLGLLYLGVFLC